jgi:hypothetical protein
VDRDRRVQWRLVADLAAVASCVFACVTLGRVAWRLRRQVSFGTTGYILGLIVVTVAMRRLIDVEEVRHAIDSTDPRFAAMTAVVSILIACGIGLLIPFFQKIVDFGLTAGMEHDKFLTLAENTQESFCLLESVHNPLHRIKDFRFTFIGVPGVF